MPTILGVNFLEGCDQSAHIQNGKPARRKNPGKMGKKMENGPRPEMAEKWPPKWKNGQKSHFGVHFSIFGGHFSGISGHFPFLSHFLGIFASRRFPILYMATSIATGGPEALENFAENSLKKFAEKFAGNFPEIRQIRSAEPRDQQSLGLSVQNSHNHITILAREFSKNFLSKKGKDRTSFYLRWPQLGPFFVPARPPLTAINGH